MFWNEAVVSHPKQFKAALCKMAAFIMWQSLLWGLCRNCMNEAEQILKTSV